MATNGNSPDPMTDLVPAASQDNLQGQQQEAAAPAAEPKLPTRKDASLKEFISKMDDYAPIVSLTLSRLVLLE